jgi:peptidoglycan-associated lipoprotein
LHLTNWISVVGEVTGTHGNHISTLGQDLTLFTFSGGPEVSYPGRRVSPFARVLFGEGHASDSYFPTSTGGSFPTASSFALTAGGGIDYKLTSHFAVRASGDYFRTSFPNGSTGSQNHVMIGAGILYRIGEPKEAAMPPIVPQPIVVVEAAGPTPTPPPPPPPPRLPEQTVSLRCSTAVSTIDQGDTLEVLGSAVTDPSSLQVTYTWTTGVGTLIGSGAQVLVDTDGVPPGSYHVIGHVVANGRNPLTADCDVPFRIQTMAETVKAPAAMPMGPAIDPAKEKEFHDNVQDALFDYDKANIRPDTQRAINHAAEYLASHPEIRVLLGGYADNRGSLEYNLVLGEKRARTVRAALIAAGVAPERLEIVTYGKFVQVCTAATEHCRQLNRRVAFAMHP